MLDFPFSMTSAVDHKKLKQLWPIYRAEIIRVHTENDGMRPKTITDLASWKAIAACKEKMVLLGISIPEAPSYGTRLSMMNTIFEEEHIRNRFDSEIINETPSEDLLFAISLAPMIKTGIIGIRMDFDWIENHLKGVIKNADQ